MSETSSEFKGYSVPLLIFQKMLEMLLILFVMMVVGLSSSAVQCQWSVKDQGPLESFVYHTVLQQSNFCV